MSKRTVTGVVYVAVFLALTALKWLIPGGWGFFGFDILFCAISIIGSGGIAGRTDDSVQ